MMLIYKRGQRGFTLLELLIALAIFALIGAAAFAGLDTTLELRQQAEQTGQRLANIQFALQIIERDLEQIIPRSVRDDSGSSQNALQTGSNNAIVSLSRSGWDNFLQQPRSQLQRVQYELREQNLVRVYWPHLDGAYEARESVLLTGVADLRLRWLNQQRQWQNRWPLTPEQAQQLPLAAEIMLVLNDWGEIPKLILLPQS